MKLLCPMKNLKNLFFVFFFMLVSLGQALAASSMSLTATPVRLGDDFSIRLNPGEKKQVQLKVRNGSLETIVLESAATDFIVAEDGFTPVAVESTEVDNRWSLASWLTLAPAQHKLASEEVATVNVLIEVPDNALPGGHYAMIHHRPVNAAEAETGSGSGISQRVGTLLYVIVNGPINEEAYISQFNWPKFLENGPVDFSLNIENQSDIHINTKPVVKVYNMFGKQVANLETEAKNIFPKSERDFAGTWSKVWGLGYYKAVAEASYGSQGQVMTATAGLFMIPVKLILAILIVLMIVAIIVISIKKRKNSSSLGLSSTEEKTDEEPNDTSKEL